MSWKLRFLARLLGQAWPVWIGFGVPLLGWYTLPFIYPGPKPILYLGVAMEAIGLLVVAYELIEVREHLDSPGMMTIARRWLADVGRVFSANPLREQSPELPAVGADPGTAKTPLGLRGFAESQAILDQIVTMMRAVETLHKRLDTLQRLKELEDHVHGTGRQAGEEVRRLASQLRALSLGNIGREFMGVCLIVFGLVMANLSQDLHTLWLALRDR